MSTALTYSTTGKSRDLRTVLVEDVKRSVILLPTGSLSVVTAKLLQGTCSAAEFWASELGTDSDTFIVPASQVVAERTMTVAAIVRKTKRSN